MATLNVRIRCDMSFSCHSTRKQSQKVGHTYPASPPPCQPIPCSLLAFPFQLTCRVVLLVWQLALTLPVATAFACFLHAQGKQRIFLNATHGLRVSISSCGRIILVSLDSLLCWCWQHWSSFVISFASHKESCLLIDDRLSTAKYRFSSDETKRWQVEIDMPHF